MTDIEKKALALANEVRLERGFAPLPNIYRTNYEIEALCRAIEQHEAFRQEVSDVITYIESLYPVLPIDRERFIIPAPKPDPLLAALLELELSSDLQEGQHDAKWIRNKLDALGFEIREKNDG